MREGLIQKVVQKVKKLLVNKDKNTASDFFISIKHLSKTNARGFGFINFTKFLPVPVAAFDDLKKIFCRCSQY